MTNANVICSLGSHCASGGASFDSFGVQRRTDSKRCAHHKHISAGRAIGKWRLCRGKRRREEKRDEKRRWKNMKRLLNRNKAEKESRREVKGDKERSLFLFLSNSLFSYKGCTSKA